MEDSKLYKLFYVSSLTKMVLIKV